MKIFSPSLKGQMKDCLLSIFWPKKEIYSFFRNCNVPAQVLKIIDKWDEKGFSRADMVNEAFDSLGNQPDNGTLHFNVMLETLSDWTYFNDYWFKEQKKLDLGEAKKKIAALKPAKEKSVDAARNRASQQKEKTKALEKRHSSLEEMNLDFQNISMGSDTPQKRGHAFEKFLAKMARFYDIKVTEGFKIKGTQIDGIIKFDGENYTIEAKWHDHCLSGEPLMAFCNKQGINMHGRGIFISVNGFSEGALSLLERSLIKNIVLMDGEDITLILTEMISFPEVLDKKVRAAQTQGKFYIHPITLKSKIIS